MRVATEFHRDTKLSELVGEAVIVRESVEMAGGGETTQRPINNCQQLSTLVSHFAHDRMDRLSLRFLAGEAEVVRQRTEPGGIATADIVRRQAICRRLWCMDPF